MTLNCVERHIQHAGNLARIKVFLVAKYHNHSRLLWQRVHHSTQHFRKKKIILGCINRGLRDIFKADLRPDLLPPRLVDAAMAGDLAQPEREVVGRFDRAQILMQIKKNFLRQLFRKRTVPQKMARHAENHTLVLTYNLLEGKLIAESRPFEPIIEPGCRCLIQCDCSFPPHHTLVRKRFINECTF